MPGLSDSSTEKLKNLTISDPEELDLIHLVQTWQICLADFKGLRVSREIPLMIQNLEKQLEVQTQHLKTIYKLNENLENQQNTMLQSRLESPHHEALPNRTPRYPQKVFFFRVFKDFFYIISQETAGF